MLIYENSRNPIKHKRDYIRRFITEYSEVYIGKEEEDRIHELSKEIMKTGIKSADAAHTACAIIAVCDYLLTTDDRLLKYNSEKIEVINPTQFILLIGGKENE